MLFRVSGRGGPPGRHGSWSGRRRKMAAARLGDAGCSAPRRGGGRLWALGRLGVLPRLRLRALLLRSRRALARLRDRYAELVGRLIAEAAAAEPPAAPKARKTVQRAAEHGTGTGETTLQAPAGRPVAVVPAAVVVGAVLRCNSHYYVR